MEDRRTDIEALGWVGVVGLAPIAALHLLPVQIGFFGTLLEAGTFYLFLPAWLIAAYAVVAKRRALASCAAALCALHFSWIAPGTITKDAPDHDAPRLRVATANLLVVNPTPDALIEELLTLEADVIALEELSPEWARALDAHGVFERYPHGAVVPRDDCFGIALLSRHPLLSRDVIDLEGVPAIRALVHTEHGDVTMFAVHTLPPRTPEYANAWRTQMARLAQIAEATEGPFLMMGDFNASPYAREYRTLASGALRGAHEARGRGLSTTWPNGVFSVPPMRLDHVLVSEQLAVVDVREGIGEGSDHRPVIAELALPRESVASAR